MLGDGALPHKQRSGMGGWQCLAGLLAVSITVSMLNSTEIEIDIYLDTFTGPLPLFLFISFLIGSFVTLLFFFSAYIKQKHDNRNLKRAMKIKRCNV